MKVKKKSLLNYLKLLSALIIIYFLVQQVSKNVDEIFLYVKTINGWFFSSLAVFTLFLMMQGWNWIQILNYPHRHIAVSRGLHIYINSQFAKYIPGGVWNYIGRVMLTSAEGVSVPHQMATIFYEHVLLITAAAIYGLYLLYEIGYISELIIIWIGISAFLFHFFYTPLTSFINRKLSKIKKINNITWTLPRNKFYLFLIYFLISHFVMGLSYWMLIRSFYITDISLFYAAGTFALAWLIGLLSPLPGGLGVREGMLLYFLSFYVDSSVALQIAIISRIWNICGEILFYIIANSWATIKKGWKYT
ncbi:lysylphosphatidylglycerol synthase transmembrane domain-containing protein [Longirhabdus pacifica]|uniref:lysylphosphatidylglycerol synthase transmembrane domain-containing protein n=1 Tax=Longirhabdus pacifica TaxID=2305227 RepID=UPI0013E8C867|nr:lysylphosphatidylglycerol synthase transmembrane domain-containing protein [Longirhabdus pacifica]